MDVPSLPTMSVPEELAYYYALTRDRYTGAGAVVEVGCWLGAGTVRLAAGLRDGGKPGRVVAIDRFVWQGELYERIHPAGLAAGDDFQPLFVELTRPLAPWIKSVRTEVAGFRWDRGPIEILVVDAPKQAADVVAVIDGLAGSLLPAGGVLAFQDYLHPPSYALPAILSLLGDALAQETVIIEGCLVAFASRRPIRLDDDARARTDLGRWTVGEAQAAFARVAASLPDAAANVVRLSLAFFLHDLHATEAACALAGSLAADPDLRWRMGILAPKSVYWRYRPIFEVFGIAPERLTADMLVKRSIFEHRDGRTDAAIAACRQALEIEPCHPAATARLAKLEALGRRPRPQSALASRPPSA